MAATTENRVCYFCNQQGHIAANCPKKRQQRQQQNLSSRLPGQFPPSFPPRQQGYQRQPQQQNRLYNNPGGRNVVPNRPHFQLSPGIIPATPTPSTTPAPTTYNGNPQPHHPQYPPPTHQHPAAGYYSAPSFPVYQPMTHQYSPARYFSGNLYSQLSTTYSAIYRPPQPSISTSNAKASSFSLPQHEFCVHLLRAARKRSILQP